MKSPSAQPSETTDWAAAAEEEERLIQERKLHNKQKHDRLKQLRKNSRERFINLVFPTTRDYADWCQAVGADAKLGLDDQITKIWQVSKETYKLWQEFSETSSQKHEAEWRKRMLEAMTPDMTASIRRQKEKQ